MTTGDEAYAASGTVFEIEDAPIDLDLSRLLHEGIRRIRVTSRCDLSSQDPVRSLSLVRLLREAASDNVAVEWHGRVLAGVDSLWLHHLTPPAAQPDDEPDIELMSWRTRHQPGLCYFRLGPDFVFVKDVRKPDASARFRLVGEDTLRAFRALEPVVEVAGLDSAAGALLDDLEAESLALRLGAYATLLPNRMRRWPVPSHEV